MLVKWVWELVQAWTLCSDSGVEVRQNKSRAYWFLKHSLSQPAYCLLPLETLLSILHDLPSQSSSLWHAAISAVAQGIVSAFFHNPPPLHFVSSWDISEARSSGFSPLYHFPHVMVFSMHDSSHSLTADSLKTASIIHFFWQGGIIAWGQRDESSLAAQCIRQHASQFCRDTNEER